MKAAIAWLLSGALFWSVTQAAAHGGARPAGNAKTAAGAPMPAADPAKMWAASLAKQPLAATATFDADGRLWLAKVANRHVYVSFSDDKGKTFSAAVAVNPEPEHIAADGENRPKIMVAGKIIYVSYTQALEQPMSGNIRFSRSLDGGKTFSVPITVNDNWEIISHRFEAMGINDKGQVYLAWLDKRDLSAAQKKGEKYAGAAVYYAVSDDGGASFRPNIKIADHSCECCRTVMAMDTDGFPVIMWRHVYDTNIRDHALVKLDGRNSPQRVSHDNWDIAACPHHGPAISIATDGVYHITWFTNAKQRHGLFYAYSSDRGKRFSTPLNFGNFEAQAAHPHVLSLGAEVYLAWKEFDGESSVTLAMRSTDGGKTWATPRKIAATGDISDNPLLINDGSKVYLSWNTLKEGYRLLEIPGDVR